MSKQYTIMVLPKDHSAVRRFSLTSSLIKAILLVFTLTSLAFSWVLYDYVKIKKEVSGVYSLKAENKTQRVQLQDFAEKVEDFELQMSKLNRFDWKLRNFADLNPGSEPSTVFGLGGPSPSEFLNEEDLIPYNSKLKKKIRELKEKALEQEKSFNELYEHFLDQKNVLLSTPSIWPAGGWLASGFGYRISPFTGLKQKHFGLDIASRKGDPVIATAEGKVIKTGKDWALGKYVIVNHGQGIKTKYGHLSKILVKKGQKVKRGDKIGAIGNTGRSTGPHLHYEVIVKGKAVNPMRYILN